MHGFKIGDKLRAKENSRANHITKGKLYTCLDIKSHDAVYYDDDYVVIRGDREQEVYVFAHRFEAGPLSNKARIEERRKSCQNSA